MEKILYFPAGIAAFGGILALLILLSPNSFGIKPDSVDLIIILFPTLTSVLGVSYFLSKDVSSIKTSGEKTDKDILNV